VNKSPAQWYTSVIPASGGGGRIWNSRPASETLLEEMREENEREGKEERGERGEEKRGEEKEASKN
jgi:hypothetical protein